MKLFIYTNLDVKPTEFEVTRLRKNTKGMLELLSIPYSSYENENPYSIKHYFTLSDVSLMELPSQNNGEKSIISLLYNENDANNYLLNNLKNNDGKLIKAADLKKINLFNAGIVPSVYAINLLRSEGVTIPLFALNPGVNIAKFTLTNSIIKDVFFKLYNIAPSEELAYFILKENDLLAIENIKKIVAAFPKIKFVLLTNCTNHHQERVLAKKFNHIKNVLITSLIEEDAYFSLVYHAKYFINVNTNYSNVIETMEAFASKTNVFCLLNSVDPNIAIDKENSYLYNNLDELINGLNNFEERKIDNLTAQAYQFAKDNSLGMINEKLIKIYKEIKEL